jgi:hypothetical protein
MNNVRLIRDNHGALHIAVGDHYAVGARVSSIATIEGDLSAVVIIPMKNITVEEQSTVVPFVRRDA